MKNNYKNWYVIQTKPHREEQVCSQLKNRFEIFLPTIRYFRGKAKEAPILSEKPLFPSYIFAQANLQDLYTHRLVKFTRGVNKILGSETQPVPVPSEIIDLIKEKMSGRHFLEESLRLRQGDQVRVRKGILKDLIGIIERPVSAVGRIQVLLRLMHHQMKAFLYCSEVEKVC